MASDRLELEQTRALFQRVAEGMIAGKDLLTELDRAIGDGDHGIGMARGFEAVLARLPGPPPASLGALLDAIGSALLTSMGGASGVVFGTLFRAGGRRLAEARALDAPAFAAFLEEGLAAVQARGGARPGDKTMIDALAPAAAAARECADGPLGAALAAAAEAARGGVEATRAMVARAGRARALGERALGHPDPGAASMHRILALMAEHAGAAAPAAQEGTP